MFHVVFGDKQDEARFWNAFHQMKSFFRNCSGADNLIAFDRNFSFRLDEKFTQAIDGNSENPTDYAIFWRIHILTWFAAQVLKLEGDFVECGVYHGYSAKVLCDYLDFSTLNRWFYLYDTFCGLPEETSTEYERSIWNPVYQHEGNQGLVEHVKARFAKYPNVKVIQGIVPHSFETALPDKIAFLHVDMNSMQAEMLALEALYDRMVPGGIIVLDDYGWLTNREQMAAERAFFLERGKMVMELPTGQGIVMR